MLGEADEISARLKFARRLIRDGGALAKAHFQARGQLAVESKAGSQDLVTLADRDVEALLRTRIEGAFPQDGLLGEEHGLSGADASYLWVIDPIDGTNCFVHGLPDWCVVLACIRQDQVLFGMIFVPCTGDLYWAVAGKGAYRNGRRIHTSEAGIENGFIAIGGSSRGMAGQIGGIIEALLSRGGSFVRNGSAAHTLALVAAGHYVGYFQPKLCAWDSAAGLLLVREAGGVADDVLASGGLLERRDVFAVAKHACHDLRKIVAWETICQTATLLTPSSSQGWN